MVDERTNEFALELIAAAQQYMVNRDFTRASRYLEAAAVVIRPGQDELEERLASLINQTIQYPDCPVEPGMTGVQVIMTETLPFLQPAEGTE